jgi:phage shock protein C
VKRLYRNRSDKVISGVCGGLGKYLGIDPIIVRIVWAFLIFAMGTGVLAYIIAMIIIPLEPIDEDIYADSKKDLSQPQLTSSSTTDPAKTLLLVAGIIIIIIGIAALFGNIFGWIGWLWGFGSKLIWPVIIIVVGVLILVSYTKKQ